MSFEKELKICKQYLAEKKIILYPTDTIWGIGCDATKNKSVKRIFKIKQRKESKSLIVLVSDFEMLANYVFAVSNEVKLYLQSTTHPTTVIYKNPKNLAKRAIASDNTVAIRIVSSSFAHDLIKTFGKPIISSSANISGKNPPKSFKDISKKIIKKVDYVANVKEDDYVKSPSKIITFKDGVVVVLRS